MSIAQAAQLVRAQGRGPDTELMHVTPGEVQALQGLAQLHGGSLTRNPQTGLPEASFLQSILPTLAGIGVGFATGNPLIGAAVAGGLGYGTSGSLEKGLLSGIGAFGGASALGSLASTGATTAATAGAAAGTPAAAMATNIGPMAAMDVAMAGGNAAAQSAAAQGVASGAAGQLQNQMVMNALPASGRFAALGQGFQNLASDPSGTFSAMGGLSGQGLNLGMAAAPLLGGMMDQQQQTDIPQQDSLIRPQVYDPVTQSYTSLEPVQSSEWGTRSFDDYRRQFGFQAGGQVMQRYEQPTQAVDPSVQAYNQMLMNQAQQEYVQGRPMTDVPQLTPSLMAPQQPAQQTAQPPAQQVSDTQQYMFDPSSNTIVANPAFTARQDRISELERQVREAEARNQSMADTSLGFGGMHGYAVGGRIPRLAQGGIAGIPAFQAGGDMQSDSFVVPADVVSALGNGSTDAGVEVLNQYLGMALPIQGPGDGLSDDIPATIDGEQPARVADGEVYVPPEVVAQLGDGDYERGSAKLYAMMDRIREKAHGSTEQQTEVRPEEVMPT